METARERVLSGLKANARITAAQLGEWANRPAASVRRIVQELRAEGHNITSDGKAYTLQIAQ